MNTFLLLTGVLAGISGGMLCAVAAAARLGGRYFLGAFQLGTLLLAGIALMTAACVCLLLVLVRRTGQRP